MLMLLFSQALWPTENHAVTHCCAMAHRLKTSGLGNVYFAVNGKILLG